MSADSAVQEALAEGYAFPCACCKKLWRAKAVGYRGGCEAQMKGEECSGPVSGRAFPLYEGPLTLATLASHCFRCGDGPLSGSRGDKVIEMPSDPGRQLGLCKRHLPMLDRMVPHKEEMTG